MKEIEGYGYRRISYILYEKGFRSIRTDSILKNNYIYSIYKKGKIREQRINREYETYSMKCIMNDLETALNAYLAWYMVHDCRSIEI